MNTKIISFSAIALASVLSLASCKSKTNVTFDQVNTQLAGNWYFMNVGDSLLDTTDEQWPNLDFNTKEGTVSGFAGCNRLMGNFSYTNSGQFKFDNMASTRMMCPDMKLEDELQKLLPTVTGYSINNVTGVLTFTNAAGVPVVKMNRQNPRVLMQYKQSY